MNSKSKLKIIGVALIAIGVLAIGVYSQSQNNYVEPEQDTTAEKPVEILVNKTFTNEYNGFSIDYQVGIENGVEETPPPDVLIAISESYSEEEKAQLVEDYYNSTLYQQQRQYDEQRGNSSIYLIKQFIDEGFSCTSYKELAYKYKADSIFDNNGDWVSAENYIYERAINECIKVEEEDLK